MNPPVLNREFKHPDDGWYMIEPMGEHLNRAAGVLQVIDPPAIESITNRFNQAADQPDFAGMLVDHEHFRHDLDKESRAYGWLMRLANRADGLYGQILWTKTGKEAVDGGDYRYFSTEYDPADATVLNRTEKPPRLRPLCLVGLTLTNSPNNKGGKPITNRDTDEFRQPASAAPAGNSNQPPKNTMTNEIKTLLGLPADASDESILAGVTTLKNRAETAETKTSALEKANSDLMAACVESDLAKYSNRIKPEARDKIKAQLLANRASTLDLLDAIPEPIIPAPAPAPAPVAASAPTPAPIHNRETTGTPPTTTETFPTIVNRLVATGKTKAQAIREAMITNATEYATWREKGGQI